MLEGPTASDKTQPWWCATWFKCLLVTAALVLLYAPALQSGFTWDDDEHLTQNPCIIGPQSIGDIWTTRAARICPLVLSTFWLEHRLWGLSPLPYHLVNVLMHAGAALLLWRVLLALRVPGAWLGALLWALHPVQVETVAWVTELKNTQSGLFFLASILFYLRLLRGEGRNRTNYTLSMVFALLGMASKTSVVVLPAVLALCTWYVEGRVSRQRLVRLMPYVLMALAASVLALWTQDLEGANDPRWQRSIPQRLATAGAVAWFYFGKLVWPHPLVFVYPKWQVNAANMLWWLPFMGLMAAIYFTRRWRGIWLALLYFIIALGPVLGLLDHYFLRYSFVGDHFQYLASIGPLAFLGVLMSKLPRWVPVALLTAFSAITWHQQRLYRDPQLLWTHTLQHHPTCWLACNNLGIMLYQAGRTDDAIELWERALQSDPKAAKSHNNLALALVDKGRTEEAIEHYREALRLDPDYGAARANYGSVLLSQGKVNEALAELQQATKLAPRDSGPWANLGTAHLVIGDIAEAISDYEKAIEAAPENQSALNNLAWILATQPKAEFRDGPRAVKLITRVVELSAQPSVKTLRTLAAAQAESGDFNAAIKTATEAQAVARANGDGGMVNALQSELAAYRQDTAIRYTP